MQKSAKNMNGWQDPDQYEAQSWKLGTPRGEHVRQRRLHAVLQLLQDNTFLLDVGAGPGTLSKDFPCKVVATDLSIPMLNKAKQRVDTVIRADAQYLPFKEESFDTSFESSCLYLVDNKQVMVREMKRIARKQVILFESNRLSLRRLYEKYARGVRMRPEHPSPSEVKKYLASAGLSAKIRMVGFSPMAGVPLVLKLWKPVEWFVESCPGLRLFAGGILAYANIEKR